MADEEVTTTAEGEVETAATEEERRAHHAAAMMLVRQYPDPALRIAADPVATVDDGVRRLVERMTDVMRQSHGVGLAAPQMGVLRRVLIYRVSPDGDIHVLVNPELRERSEETSVDTEGCLSLLGGEIQVPVERHVSVVATALNASGEPVEVAAEGLEARVIQHEVDHLDGVLIIDRASKEDRRAALRDLRLRA
ncbi:MAG TPA: peptide deformylase [Gaiellales bacterium]|jgi:peptide deformylase|nr:peptide deformylase [Gaiellales bacterium]